MYMTEHKTEVEWKIVQDSINRVYTVLILILRDQLVREFVVDCQLSTTEVSRQLSYSAQWWALSIQPKITKISKWGQKVRKITGKVSKSLKIVEVRKSEPSMQKLSEKDKRKFAVKNFFEDFDIPHYLKRFSSFLENDVPFT